MYSTPQLVRQKRIHRLQIVRKKPICHLTTILSRIHTCLKLPVHALHLPVCSFYMTTSLLHITVTTTLTASISARRVMHAFFMEGFKQVLQQPHLCDALTFSYDCTLFLDFWIEALALTAGCSGIFGTCSDPTASAKTCRGKSVVSCAAVGLPDAAVLLGDGIPDSPASASAGAGVWCCTGVCLLPAWACPAGTPCVSCSGGSVCVSVPAANFCFLA